jgi:hypothetical protein
MTARNGTLRERLAGLERPLLLAGLALVARHLLDLAFSGPDTSLLGVLAIVTVPAAWALARPHVTRPTRLVLGVAVRGVSGMREAPSLIGLMPRIAPRPVLLIAGGVGAPDEIPANRAYRHAGGPTTELWELPDAGHTGGLRTHPAAYEQRTIAFLDQALDLTETS